MYYIGIDLHKQDLVMAVEGERGPVGRVRRLACRDTEAIRAGVERWRPYIFLGCASRHTGGSRRAGTSATRRACGETFHPARG